MIDKRFVLLNSEDNVFVCCEKVYSGTNICLEDKTICLLTDINVGHKIARKNISLEQAIIKYGAPIGSAIQAINFGDHVHMHNMKSDYIPSHTRQKKAGEKR